MRCVNLILLLVALTLSCTLCQAEFKVIHAFNEFTFGRTISTVIADSTAYGVTDSETLIAASLDRPRVELTRLPTEPDQNFEITFEPGPLATVDGLVVGSVSPGNFDVYTVAFDGTGYHTIANGDDLGIGFVNPVAVGGRIFGAASNGVFSMKPDGSDFQIVKGDIESPITSPLTFNGDKIYGITIDGFLDTSSGLGVMFSINPDGSDYTTVTDIDISPSALAAKGDILYGADGNKVFSINTDGTDLQYLAETHSRISQVVVAGDKIFGVTPHSGPSSGGYGTLFRSNLDGSNLETIHEFGPGEGNGNFPNNDLVVIGSTLYGSTFEGGFERSDAHPVGGGGIIYSLPVDTNAVPEPLSIVVWLVLGAVVAFGSYQRPRKPIR